MTRGYSHEPSSDADFQRALENCASEPVHIPGSVQPFGCLIGFDATDMRITYASDNCEAIIGLSVDKLLGKNARDVFDSEFMHELSNAKGRSEFAQSLNTLGQYNVNTHPVDASAFASDGVIVVQLEARKDPGLGGKDALSALSLLMRDIHACTDQATLFELMIDLMRHLTGYDRVLIYKFDEHHNGEVIAESKKPTMETMLGLRFPEWDIPAQARAIMAQIPLRFIEDTEQAPIPLRAETPASPPLDITLAETRGVSPIHLQYLRNMGVRGSMTLSIKSAEKLWGIISFHHRRPRVPALRQREVLKASLEVFCTKLEVLQKQEQLDLVARIDQLQDKALVAIEKASKSDELDVAAPIVLDVLQSDGLAILTGSAVRIFGITPEQNVLDHLSECVRNEPGGSFRSDNLESDFPDLKPHLNGCAGASVKEDGPNRTFFVFRKELGQSVSWAGNPEKKIDLQDGTARLHPRASFSSFLDQMTGFSKPWTQNEIYLEKRIWSLIYSAERQELRNKLSNQQALMILELNHRVRNILSLVRAVSRQARKHGSSLQSYSSALERRIHAFAAAHDLASGNTLEAVNLQALIEVEINPYRQDTNLTPAEDDVYLRADIAPIFSLVIHELATNAVKYGALSQTEGQLQIKIENMHGGVRVFWTETGGPQVNIPNERGFGTTLIEQAVPYELGGEVKLEFAKTGVRAEFFLPHDVLDHDVNRSAPTQVKTSIFDAEDLAKSFDPKEVAGAILLVEDNFSTARDTAAQPTEFGFSNVQACSNELDAEEILETENVCLAILDVNLGPDRSSENLALRLLKDGVPFFFATGYGDEVELDPRFQHVRKLVKPIEDQMLRNMVATTLLENGSNKS